MIPAVQSDPWTRLPFIIWSRLKPWSKQYRSSCPSGYSELLGLGENGVKKRNVKETGWNGGISRACWVTSVWRLWLVGAPKQRHLPGSCSASSRSWTAGYTWTHLRQQTPESLTFSGHLCPAVTSELCFVFWNLTFAVVASSSLFCFSASQ